jgi:hypothetical protein
MNKKRTLQQDQRDRTSINILSSIPANHTTPNRSLNPPYSQTMSCNGAPPTGKPGTGPKWRQWRANDPGDPCEYTAGAARLTPVFEGQGDDEQEVCAFILSFPLATAITNAICTGRQRSRTMSHSEEKRKDIESRRIDATGQLKCANILLKRYEKQYRAKTELKRLDREERDLKKKVKKSKEVWNERWRKVEGLLEGVWMDADISVRTDGDKKGSDKNEDEDGGEQDTQKYTEQGNVANPENPAVSPISQISGSYLRRRFSMPTTNHPMSRISRKLTHTAPSASQPHKSCTSAT